MLFFQCYETLVASYQHPQLIFIDLDNFKQLNDTLGHQRGDELLIEFANCLKTQSAQRGEAYRFGGDEFVIIYNHPHCTDLISAINKQMSDTFQATKVSISYGSIVINANESADTQILKVDELMYKNKQQRKSLRKPAR